MDQIIEWYGEDNYAESIRLAREFWSSRITIDVYVALIMFIQVHLRWIAAAFWFKHIYKGDKHAQCIAQARIV